MKTWTLFLAFFIGYNSCHAQLSRAARDSLARLSAVDHTQMKEQLGIATPNRPGSSGNPEASDAANREEAAVQLYDPPVDAHLLMASAPQGLFLSVQGHPRWKGNG